MVGEFMGLGFRDVSTQDMAPFKSCERAGTWLVLARKLDFRCCAWGLGLKTSVLGPRKPGFRLLHSRPEQAIGAFACRLSTFTVE